MLVRSVKLFSHSLNACETAFVAVSIRLNDECSPFTAVRMKGGEGIPEFNTLLIQADGTLYRIFELDDEHAANLNWGGADYLTLYLTAQNGHYRRQTLDRGIATGSR